ncbi:uncharacterized protein LOC132704470 [Cylas formicarius]|uniref:uncharacterized protein LOC132704470 n=1 Tax=Cylas formicarius TaxID=197179 RepID=UPI0029583F8E|nr:uncharacterized protein LOC132704470 [Cylas formicarius]
MLLLIAAIVLGTCMVRADVYDGSTNRPESGEAGSDITKTTEWDKIGAESNRHDQRSFQSDSRKNNLNKNDDGGSISLKEFLETYAKGQNRKTKPVTHYEDQAALNLDKLIQQDQNADFSDDKSKSWSLQDVQRHSHPFEDKKGWVSLEPIPWSVSKVSKWHSKYRPVAERPTQMDDVDDKPWENEFDYRRPVSITPPSPYIYNKRPSETSDRFDLYHDDEENYPRPSLGSRPSATYGHKVHVQTSFPSNSYSSTGKPYLYHHNDKNCDHPSHPYDGIITDGMPSNFPHSSPYSNLRRRGSDIDIHSDNHPFNGNGEWVLLSTTKGYRPPKNRQRSLDLGTTLEPTQSLGTHRSVRLTVLPPLKNSKVNMTTSHGGLLQVASTSESVEQSKEKLDKKNRLKNKSKRKRRKNNKNKVKIGLNQITQTPTQVASIPRGHTDPSAVMAAVGAGLIPATMAMMVPLAMSGGKRRKRNVRLVNNKLVPNIEISLPRYL